MSEERLKFQGRLMEKELTAKGLETQIDGLVRSLRDLLDPFEQTAELKTDLIADQAMRLGTLQIRYKEALAEIGAIKKVLGRA